MAHLGKLTRMMGERNSRIRPLATGFTMRARILFIVVEASILGARDLFRIRLHGHSVQDTARMDCWMPLISLAPMSIPDVRTSPPSYYTVLYYTILYYTILYYTMLYYY